MIKTYNKAALLLLLISVVTMGCSKGKEAASTVEESRSKSKEPVTLTLYLGQPGIFDFESTGVMEAIKKKFPHITLNINVRGKNNDYKDLIVTGELPDIIYDSASFTVSNIMRYGFHYDMEELIRKNNFDLKQFEPNVLGQTQYANSEGKLYGLPFTMNRYALFYNKEIFNKFGAPYPKDGMTWDEIYELSKKVTREEQGTNYIGFASTPNNLMLNNQLSLSPLDTKEDKGAVNTDGWKTLFENLTRFYEVPGNKLVASSETAKGTVALALESHPLMLGWAKSAPNLNWDVASVPSLKEKPGVGLKPATLALFVTQTSKYKDEAFQVVSFLVSEEVQTMLSKKGVGTPLVNPAVKKVFGQEVPELRGKNTGAFYYYKDAPPSPPRDAKLTNVNVSFTKSFSEIVTNKKDVNTVLRQFEEEINRAIETEKLEGTNK